MKQSSKRLASILLSLFFIVGTLIVLFDFIQPAYGTVDMLKAQVAGQRTLLDTESAAITKAKQLVAQYQAQSQGAENVSLALPTSLDLAGALAQVYGLAQNNGVIVQSITISAPTLTPGSQTKGAILKPIGSFSLQVAAVGSYESIRNFVSGLETNVRIFDIKAFSVAQSTGITAAKAGGTDFFNYTVTAAAYYQTP